MLVNYRFEDTSSPFYFDTGKSKLYPNKTTRPVTVTHRNKEKMSQPQLIYSAHGIKLSRKQAFHSQGLTTILAVLALPSHKSPSGVHFILF